MHTARMAVPTLLAIAAVAAAVIATPMDDTHAGGAGAEPATPYSTDHARIPAQPEAEPAPTF